MDRHTTTGNKGCFAAAWGSPLLILLILGLGLGGWGALVAAQRATTTLVSVNAAGTASSNGGSDPVALSPDGRFVLFMSNASDLVANDTNGTTDAFVRGLHQEDDEGLGEDE